MTNGATLSDELSKSHPARVRGLKDRLREDFYLVVESHPARVRGLKVPSPAPRIRSFWSHPARVRGLKVPRREKGRLQACGVAPRAGAWIESSLAGPSRRTGWKRRTPRGCVD